MKEKIKFSLSLCVILIALTAIIAGGIGYFSSIVITKSNTGISEEINSTQNQNQKQELDIESELVENLNKKILKYNNLSASTINTEGTTEFFDASFYRKVKVKYEDLSNEEKIITVVNNIIPTDKYAYEIDINKLTFKENEYFQDDSIIKIYTKKQLEETAKKVFGEKAIDIKWETLDTFASVLEYVDGDYYSYQLEGGGLGYTDNASSVIVKAEKQGDYVYVYDKFLYCDEFEFWTEDKGVKFYSSVNKTNEIKNINAFNYKQDKLKEVIENNINECPTYKHTFEMDNKGNCYWVSTEQVL